MRRIYMKDHLLELGDLPMHQKMLHMILWERSDPIGFVKVNLELFSSMAGKYAFTENDLNDLAPTWLHRWSSSEVFLPNFLKTQQATLSKTSQFSFKVWSCLKDRWNATKEDPSPYFQFMSTIGKRFQAPEIPDEYHDREGVKPAWYVKFLQRLELPKAIPTPDWPENIASAYNAMIDNYVELARNTVTSRSKAENEFYVDSKRIENSQSMIQLMLNKGFPPEIIEQQIRFALNSNKISIILPPSSWKHQTSANTSQE